MLDKISPQALKYLVLINPTILLLIAVVVGTLLYDKVRFSVPTISSILKIEQPKIKLIEQVKFGVFFGLLAGILMTVIGIVFKSSLPPMLCDVTKIHTGYGIMPRVTHCTEDENWGKIGSSKKVFVEKSLTHKGGFGSVDNVKERIEDKYWKIEINQFQA